MRDQRTIDKEPTVGYDPGNLCQTPWLLKVYLGKSASDCDGYADGDDSECSGEPVCLCLPKGSSCDAEAECR